MIMTYKVSKDYKRLKQLLDEGNKIVCFVDYAFNLARDMVTTDIAIAECRGIGEYMRYSVFSRGFSYITIYPSLFDDFSDEKLYKTFECDNVQFIDPDYEPKQK